MRVITGSLRGMKLKTLEGLEVRPTTDQVKESVFSIIQFEVPGARVLDLFAGSGQLGIEALSRGASHATFVDNRGASISVVRENLFHTHMEDKSTVKNEDSISYLQRTNETFDIAFLDPPYGKGLVLKALEFLPQKMSNGGVIVCETSKEETLPESAGKFLLYKEYKYGKIKITVYRTREEND